MSGRRINPVHTSTSHFGSVLSIAPGSARQARRAAKSLARQRRDLPRDLEARVRPPRHETIPPRSVTALLGELGSEEVGRADTIPAPPGDE